jgi:hypothetical protein
VRRARGDVIASVTRPERGPLGALLSLRPLRWIGEISYGLYVWHWPLYVLISEQRTGLDGAPLLVARLAATVATATASYYLVERPIRRGALTGVRLRILTPATAGVVAVALVLTTGGARTPVSEVAAADIAPPPTATSVASGESGPVRVLVVGDSVANSMATGLERAGPSHGMLVWNAAVDGCGISQDVGERRIWDWERARPSCSPGWRERWPAQISQFDPDIVVVLVGNGDTWDRRVDGREVSFDSLEGDELTRRELQEAVTILPGRRPRRHAHNAVQRHGVAHSGDYRSVSV